MTDKLLMLNGDRPTEHELGARVVLIGSDPGCAIQHTGFAKKHATVERHDGVWTVFPSPGAPLEQEGRALSHLRLDHGTGFQLGGVAFKFLSEKATIERSVMAGAKFANQADAVANLKKSCARINEQVAKIVIGQKDVVRQVITALFAQGHCLLIGAPGLAKTLLARVLGGTLDLQSKRIQFTPDLMPSDIVGTDVLEEDPATGQRRFRFKAGPLFTNLLLADEINRTPPKTQAALLEAMQERRITAAGVTMDLPQPFLVLATQNPIEQEGTYPLPEAQLDRFMFAIKVGYPDAADEARILLETTGDLRWEVERVLDAEGIQRFQHLVRQVPVSPHVAAYATSLIRASRPGEKEADEYINRNVRFGAGPRAGQYLLLAAKAHALIDGNGSVSCADIRANAAPVLRHRIFTSFAAASDGIDSDAVVARLLQRVKEPEYK
ncbi:MAG TPA: AAA family ATPase [Planctomycetota bacterium]|nr:AAA family ATPase [Planctomycetota bacterium]